MTAPDNHPSDDTDDQPVDDAADTTVTADAESSNAGSSWRDKVRSVFRPGPVAIAIALAVLAFTIMNGDEDKRSLAILPPGFELKEAKQFGFENLESIPTPEGVVGPTIRVHYPAGSASQTATRNEDAPVGGVQYTARSPRRLGDVVHLRYWVRFAPDFDFVRGGKLPGLYGGSNFSGRQIPDGTDGLSTRFMWRREGAGEVYAYLPDSTIAGTSLGRGDWTFPRGEWVLIEQEVVLNDPSRADGSITVWIDEEKVAEFTDLRFRTTADLGINGMFMSTFFGGDDTSWAPKKSTWVEFSGFAVSDHYIGTADTRAG